MLPISPRPPRTNPTIKDVARAAGVSTATVSHVLNNNNRTSAKTRDKVLKIIEKLHYRPNGNAASLRNQRSRLIGLVLPSFTNSFFARMASEFEKLANASGYDIVTVTTDDNAERERERILALLSRQMEALIIYPASDTSVGGGFRPHQLPPTVLVDRAAGLDGFDTVSLNNRASGFEAATYLIENGHRDIAVLLDAHSQGPMQERLRGVREALAEIGAETRCRMVLGGLEIEECRSAIEQELRRQDRVTAVVAASNIATLGAIKAIQGLQLDMPQGISLVGYDDFDWMTALRPYVTAVAQPFEKLASSAWDMLMIQIAARKEKRAPLPARHIQVEGELRIRESTGRPS
jgi:LacI family transcriptional regulator